MCEIEFRWPALFHHLPGLLDPPYLMSVPSTQRCRNFQRLRRAMQPVDAESMGDVVKKTNVEAIEQLLEIPISESRKYRT